jgi:hypothetical protein
MWLITGTGRLQNKVDLNVYSYMCDCSYTEKGPVRTQRKGSHFQVKERDHRRNQAFRYLEPGLSASRTVLPSLWYFFMAVIGDSYGVCHIEIVTKTNILPTEENDTILLQ